MSEICFASKSWRSGAAWFNQQLVQAIAEAGATVTYVAPLSLPVEREPRHPGLRRLVVPRERMEGNWLARRFASLRRLTAGLASTLAERRRTSTFIFSIPEPLVTSLPLFALLRLSGAQVILVVHDAEPHRWSLPLWLRPIERTALTAAYHLASRLVCLTRSNEVVLQERFGVPAKKTAVIAHGAFLMPPLAPLQRNCRLLALGSIRRNKHIVEVIEAVLRSRKAGLAVTLTVAGEPQDRRHLADCVAAAGGNDAITILPHFVPDGDIPGLLEASDALVLAYDHFASQSGVAVLAALAGRPVIATRSGGLDDLFDRGLAGCEISPSPTPQAIAAAIAAFFDRPVEQWRLESEIARHRFAQALAWAPIGAAYVRLARLDSARKRGLVADA